jgi:hypothetical protein
MSAATREAQRLYLDCEFAEKRGRVKLISIALVRDNGDEFYAVSAAFKARECNDWVKRHVLPKLPPMAARKTPAQIAKAMRAFIGKPQPQVWTWYGAYDWVLFSWAMGGSMVDLPEGYPMAPLDLKQSLYERSLPESVLPATPRDEHNALVDARWLRDGCVSVLRHQDLRPGVAS